MMAINISRKLYKNKNEILHYMRDRGSESYGEIMTTYGVKDYKKRATAINRAITKTAQKLKVIYSGIWGVFCGEESYEQIKRYSGFDLSSWIDTHIQWENDLNEDTLEHFYANDLVKYLSW